MNSRGVICTYPTSLLLSNSTLPTMALLPSMAMTDADNIQFYVFIASVLLVLVAYYHGALLRLLPARGPPDYFKLTGSPPPTPLPDFDVDKAKPRPYRPFRWAYHQTMSLHKLENDWWIELESTYRSRIEQRKALYAKHGKRVLDVLPGYDVERACREIMEMTIQYVCARYPNQFNFNARTGIVNNHILGTQADVRIGKIVGGEGKGPLIWLLENVPEDFLITLPDEKTELYSLKAGVACSALGWSVATKIGKPLHQIHGPIPDYKEKMQFSMDRYFSKMPVDKPIQRGSWGLEIGNPLFVQPTDPHFELRNKQDPDLTLDDISLRVDWQTLRRLPLSHAIVFNYKALFTPFKQFREEPFIPKLVLKVLKEGSKSIMEYKGTWHVEHKVLPALEEWAQEQEDNGLVPKGWEVSTLTEEPFYPGWKEKWVSFYNQ